MAIYSKICIMCNRDFRTMRISTLFCGKRCANRSRSLPLSMRESLVKRASGFTMVEDNRPNHRIKDENGLLMALALEEARKRGIVTNRPLADVAEDNLQYISPNDPALGDSTGFGVSGDNNKKQEIQHDRDSNNTDSSNDTKISIKTGIRKIGGLKTT